MRSKDPYGTHKAFLEYYTKNTTGDILEFGLGEVSTELLRRYISDDRKLVSIDNDEDWIKSMKDQYPPKKNHIYMYTDDWKEKIAEMANKQKWSIVFIDQSPWEARMDAMNAFKDIADYVIVHDVDYFPKNNMFGTVIDEFTFDFSDVFKNWNVYYTPKPWPGETGPPTLVGTNLNNEIYKEEDILNDETIEI
jgi:hypothetical protein